MPVWVAVIVMAVLLIAAAVVLVAGWKHGQKARAEEDRRWQTEYEAYLKKSAALAQAAKRDVSTTRRNDRSYARSYSEPAARRQAESSVSIDRSDDGFTTSLVAAALSNDAGVGYAVGGNFVGAILGEAMRQDPEPCRALDPDPCRSETSSSCDSSSSYESGSSSSYDSGSSCDSSSSSSSWSE